MVVYDFGKELNDGWLKGKKIGANIRSYLLIKE